MTITAPSKSLKAALARITKIARPSDNPVSGAVWVAPAAEDGGAVLSGMGPDKHLSVTLDAQVTHTFAPFGVDARALQACIGDAPVTLKPLGETVCVTCNGMVTVLPAFGLADRLDTPEPDYMPDANLHFAALEFAAHLEAVLACAGGDKYRHYLNGAALQRNGLGRVTFTATDGHRLTRRVLMPRVPTSDVKAYSRLIHTEALKAMLAACKANKQAVVRIEVGQLLLTGFVSATIGDTKILARAIEDTFPTWQRIVPHHQIEVTRVTLNRKQLQTFAKANAKTPKCSLTCTDGKMVMASSSTQTVDATAAFKPLGPCKELMTEFVVGFNPQYLLDLAGLFESETLTFHMKDAGSPSVWTADDTWRGEESDQEFVMLMPIRV